jgi:hypothetical protein
MNLLERAEETAGGACVFIEQAVSLSSAANI